MSHFADRLAAALQRKGNALCVGLDPRWDCLPLELRQRHGGPSLAAAAAAYEDFCSRVLDVVAPLVPVVKPQSAFFEACGPDGMAVLQRLLRKARDLGLITIFDGKRNDIASTATAYAEAAFGGARLGSRQHPVWEADACTVNPYLGREGVEPFLQCARETGAGVFVLVRTSNPGGGQFQNLTISSGNGAGNPLYRHVGEAVAAWAAENPGACGLGDVGAVVGATCPQELATLRQALPGVVFLIPGFGAQGGTAADVASAFRSDGLGAIISSSRGVLFPFMPDTKEWERAVEVAARSAVAALHAECPRPHAGPERVRGAEAV